MKRAALFCTFQLGEAQFAIDVLEVQEVIESAELTPVPLSAEPIVGLLNLRGQIVTCVDLRQRFDMPSCDRADQIYLVLKGGADTVSLIVDRVGDVLNFESCPYHVAPDSLTGPIKEFIEGSYEIEQGLVHVLKTAEVLKLEQE